MFRPRSRQVVMGVPVAAVTSLASRDRRDRHTRPLARAVGGRRGLTTAAMPCETWYGHPQRAARSIPWSCSGACVACYGRR